MKKLESKTKGGKVDFSSLFSVRDHDHNHRA